MDNAYMSFTHAIQIGQSINKEDFEANPGDCNYSLEFPLRLYNNKPPKPMPRRWPPQQSVLKRERSIIAAISGFECPESPIPLMELGNPFDIRILTEGPDSSRYRCKCFA